MPLSGGALLYKSDWFCSNRLAIRCLRVVQQAVYLLMASDIQLMLFG